MFNTREIFADLWGPSQVFQQDQLLLEFIQVSSRPDSSGSALEERLLTSLLFAMRSKNRAS